MPFVPFDNVAQFNVRATFQGNKWENVLNFENDAEVIDPELLVAGATILLNSWVTNMIPHLSSSYTLREVYAVDLTTSTSETATAALTTPVNGAQGGTAAPGSAALVLTHRSTKRGRSFRGRTYIGGFNNSIINGNLFDATFAASILTGFEAIKADMAELSWRFGICSRKSGGAFRTTGVFTTVAASVIRDLDVDSQRRRLNGRGD